MPPCNQTVMERAMQSSSLNTANCSSNLRPAPHMPIRRPQQHKSSRTVELKSGVLVMEAFCAEKRSIVSRLVEPQTPEFEIEAVEVFKRQRCHTTIYQDVRSQQHYAVVLPVAALFMPDTEPLCTIDLKSSVVERVNHPANDVHIRITMPLQDQKHCITFTFRTCKDFDRFYGLPSNGASIDDWLHAFGVAAKHKSSSLTPMNPLLSMQRLNLSAASESEQLAPSPLTSKPVARQSALGIIYESMEDYEPIDLNSLISHKQRGSVSSISSSRRSSLEPIYESWEEEMEQEEEDEEEEFEYESDEEECTSDST